MMMANTEQTVSYLKPFAEQILNQPWENPKFYKTWLSQTHYYTRHSTRMLAFAAGWTNPEKQGYYRRSLQHITEEQGHDMIAINDMKAIGAAIAEYPELTATRALWEPQFYKIQKNPTTLLGYILALETLALMVFPQLHERLLKTYPAESLRFIKIHAEDDPEHVTHALAQIEKCTLEEREDIFAGFHQTNDTYVQFFLKEILKCS